MIDFHRVIEICGKYPLIYFDEQNRTVHFAEAYHCWIKFLTSRALLCAYVPQGVAYEMRVAVDLGMLLHDLWLAHIIDAYIVRRGTPEYLFVYKDNKQLKPDKHFRFSLKYINNDVTKVEITPTKLLSFEDMLGIL